MKTLNSAVLKNTEFSKVAGSKLPSDSSEWESEIIDKFTEAFPGIPPSINSEIMITNIDESTGYAKGSIVLWGVSPIKVNIPIIVNDFKLSPFDVMVINANGKDPVYNHATDEAIVKALNSTSLGEPVAKSSLNGGSPIKSPGGVAPKMMVGATENLSKIAQMTVGKKDFESYKDEVEGDSGLIQSFINNSGEAIRDFIENGINSDKVDIDQVSQLIPFKPYNMIQGMKAADLIDAKMVPLNSLIPLSAGAIEVRVIDTNRSIEDASLNGEALDSAYNGFPLNGVIAECTSENHSGERMFVSPGGNKFAPSYRRDYDSVFFGTPLVDNDNAADLILTQLAKISERIMQDGSSNRRDDDKYTLSNDAHGAKSIRATYSIKTLLKPSYSDVVALYKDGGALKYVHLGCYNDSFKVSYINGKMALIGSDSIIISGPVKGIVNAYKSDDPALNLVSYGKQITMIPNSAVVLPLSVFHCINKNDMLTPSSNIADLYKYRDSDKGRLVITVDKATGKTYINTEKGRGGSPITKLASEGLSSEAAYNILLLSGVTKEAAAKTLVTAAATGKPATVFNANIADFTKVAYDTLEKRAKLDAFLTKAADSIRVNLTKQASVIQDEAAVDNVLALNFINKNNIMEFVNKLDDLNDLREYMAKLLIYIRMGFSDVDESAVKDIMEGLTIVIEQLKRVDAIVRNAGIVQESE